MATNRRAPASAKEWAGRVERWRASGMSAAEFGRRFDLHPKSLLSWSARFPKEPSAAQMRAESESPHALRSQAESALSFVPLRANREPTRAASPAPLLLEVGGCMVRVPVDFDPDTLRTLVAALRSEA